MHLQLSSHSPFALHPFTHLYKRRTAAEGHALGCQYIFDMSSPTPTGSAVTEGFYRCSDIVWRWPPALSNPYQVCCLSFAARAHSSATQSREWYIAKRSSPPTTRLPSLATLAWRSSSVRRHLADSERMSLIKRRYCTGWPPHAVLFSQAGSVHPVLYLRHAPRRPGAPGLGRGRRPR